MPQKVKKAVFPVGGLGTRFLPATKAMPKEMLPIIDKPIIQYAVDEARAAGIDHFVFVTKMRMSIMLHTAGKYNITPIFRLNCMVVGE